MKTKSQILKDNGLDLRSTSVDDLRAISFAMDEYAKQSHVAERIKIVVPSDEDVAKWYDMWIAEGCSASSAIHKFRNWLKEINHIESIRTLNPGAEVVEADKNETK